MCGFGFDLFCVVVAVLCSFLAGHCGLLHKHSRTIFILGVCAVVLSSCVLFSWFPDVSS